MDRSQCTAESDGTSSCGAAAAEILAEDKPHEGEEFGYVISGHIQLRLGDNVYMIKAGESFYFSANKKHSIANTGAIRAKLIWVSTPPTF